MPSSRTDKGRPKKVPLSGESRNINQLGLDFMPPHQYSYAPRKEMESMNIELVEVLEQKISDIVEKYTQLKEENARLTNEIQQFASEREGLKSRVDAILGKLDGI